MPVHTARQGVVEAVAEGNVEDRHLFDHYAGGKNADIFIQRLFEAAPQAEAKRWFYREFWGVFFVLGHRGR